MEAATPVVHENYSTRHSPATKTSVLQQFTVVENRQRKRLLRVTKFLAHDLQLTQTSLTLPSSWILNQWVEYYCYIEARHKINKPPVELSCELIHFLKRIKYLASDTSSEDPGIFPPAQNFSLESTYRFADAALQHLTHIYRPT